MKFSNTPSSEDDNKDFVLKALQRHFRGDMQLVFQHLPEFLESPALKALLGKLDDLEKEVFEVWEMEGYGQNSETIATGFEETEETENHAEASATFPRKVTLPNGKAQQPYSFDLSEAFPELIFDGSASLIVEGHETAGLPLDTVSFTLFGTPEEAGHYHLIFSLLIVGNETETLTSDLHIIPDPRLLWKDLEPEEGQPFAKPHTEAKMLRGVEKMILGASRRGRSHAHTGAFREDDFAMELLSETSTDGWYFSAVADGAGSAKYSRRGSQLACEVAMEQLRIADWSGFEEILRQSAGTYKDTKGEKGKAAIIEGGCATLVVAALEAYRAIQAEAQAMDEKPGAFHTTLLLTAAKRFDFGWWVGAWWAGDGAIGLYRTGENIQILGAPDGGEFAGQTRFLTSEEVWADTEGPLNRVAIEVVDDFTAVALMSDGVSDPMFQTDFNMGQLENWDDFWTQLNQDVDLSRTNPKAADQLLEWLNFWSKGDHDDRTIVLLL